ncbi:MAG TPA: hypothetical protein PLG15_03700 [Candidatus Gastranaerophilaceae bacterium]|nr:hypothetical protein [Candidatus Gastranaerophilaceae bacterium]HPT41469.1 hypothetical protein [Candidatus Gastranaerophilaceae bacterium]
MSLNVSYNQSINRGIDSKALVDVTQAIFKRAESKSSELSNLDFSKFKKPDLGLDLYAGKVNAATAREISMASSGVQVSLSEKAVKSLQFLNSEASKAIFKNVEGKIALPVEEKGNETKNVYQLPKFTELVKPATDLNKDKNNSNPFYKGELRKAEKKETEEKINIFA